MFGGGSKFRSKSIFFVHLYDGCSEEAYSYGNE